MTPDNPELFNDIPPLAMPDVHVEDLRSREMIYMELKRPTDKLLWTYDEARALHEWLGRVLP